MNEVDYSPKRYNGNAMTKEFSFDWKAFVATDLIIKLVDFEGNEEILSLGADYTVQIEAIGGNVILKTAPGTDKIIIIERDVSDYQSTGYSTSPGFQGSEIEKSFDRVSCNLQEMDYNIETFKTNFSQEVKSQIYENKADTDKQISDLTGLVNNQIDDFENEVNTKIEQVNSAAQKLNRLDDVLEECETLAQDASNSASDAQKQSSIAQQQAAIAQDLVQDTQETLTTFKTEQEKLLLDLSKRKYIPFCFNSGSVDENGEANLLELIEKNNEDGTIQQFITLKAPAIYTDGQGKTNSINENIELEITNLADGDYSIQIDENEGIFTLYAVLDAKIYRQKKTPENPSIGDLWLDLSVAFESAKIFDGENWVLTTKVEAGKLYKNSDSEGEGG